jgi:hypothetical protein
MDSCVGRGFCKTHNLLIKFGKKINPILISPPLPRHGEEAIERGFL